MVLYSPSDPMHRTPNEDCLLLTFPWRLNQRRQPEVAHFDVHFRVEEKIAKLQVAMDDLVCMHVLARSNYLDEVISSFRLREPLSVTKHIHHALRAVSAKWI